MNLEDVLAQVNEIFMDVLDNDQIKLKCETVARDIKEWDSLTHIELVVAIEKHFKIKFKLTEVQGFKNVGEMCECILMKLP